MLFKRWQYFVKIIYKYLQIIKMRLNLFRIANFLNLILLALLFLYLVNSGSYSFIFFYFNNSFLLFCESLQIFTELINRCHLYYYIYFLLQYNQYFKRFIMQPSLVQSQNSVVNIILIFSNKQINSIFSSQRLRNINYNYRI